MALEVIKYTHEFKSDGAKAEVFVQKDLQGKHKDHCLCYRGCKKFKPGKRGHCKIARKLFMLCIVHNMVTPVWECPYFEGGE
jgi:hypothetical protein